MDHLTLLGVKGGPAVRPGSPMPTASLLQMAGQTIVVDCGIGVARALVTAGVTLLEIDAIFITHLHSDHVLELGPLLYTAWTTGLTRPLHVFGPEGTEQYWEHFLAAMAFDHDIRIADEGRTLLRDLVMIHSFGEGDVTEMGPIAVSALRVDHPPVTDTFALRFEGAGKCVVFSADTCFFLPLAEFAQGADVLVHEAMLTEGVDSLVARTAGGDKLRAHLLASHTPAAQAGQIATQAGVGILVLNHLIPADDPRFGASDWLAEIARTWTGPVVIGTDGMKIPLR